MKDFMLTIHYFDISVRHVSTTKVVCESNLCHRHALGRTSFKHLDPILLLFTFKNYKSGGLSRLNLQFNS